MARATAIAKHTAVRFAVVVSAPGDPDLEYRSYSLWQWDKNLTTTDKFRQITSSNRLPDGLLFEPSDPSATYIPSAQYHADDPSSVNGDYILTMTSVDAGFSATVAGTPCELRYIEFRPSGAARVKGSHGRNFSLVLTEGFQDSAAASLIYTAPSSSGGGPSNWAQFNVDSLTGRTRLYRP